MSSGVWVVGFYVAAAVVALLQFVRVRDRRLLPLMAMFALLAAAHDQSDWFVARRLHFAAGVCGLVLLGMLGWRRPA
jgi:ABC-type Co2+ transport system permease subunit